MKRIAVSVVKKDFLFLLVRRKQKEGNLQWQFPSGGIEENESDDNASIRETFEETGVVCKPLMKFGERDHPEFPVRTYYWLNEYVTGEAFVKDDDELDDVRWCTSNEVFELITSNLYERIREYLLQYGETGLRAQSDYKEYSSE